MSALRILASGRLAEVDDAGRATLLTCSWLVERPTFCPEPDSPSDLYRIEDCGARLRALTADPEGAWGCDAGHERWPYGSARWAELDAEAERLERLAG